MSIESTPEARFDAYMNVLATAIHHADRSAPMRAYCGALLLPGDRKSIEPMAARINPVQVSATHQSMHHFISTAPWSDDDVLDAITQWALPAIETSGPIEAWIVDDTGFPKKGAHSVGVTRQYCGRLGKQDNCQVAVSVSVAHAEASLPVAYRLYLPEQWAHDPERRQACGVPEHIWFQTKPTIARSLIERMLAHDIPRGVVLADAGYGNDSLFRHEISELGLRYAVGIQENTHVWVRGSQPPVPASNTRGRPRTQLPRLDSHPSCSVRDVAQTVGSTAFTTIRWREGSAQVLSSRFAAVRVYSAHAVRGRSALPQEEWLLIEWPEDAAAPTKYWLSTLPEETTVRRLVQITKMRWRIERDYEELKSELGLGHFEGRGWRGFHHHATMCIAAYAFLVAERGLFPPEEEATPRLFIRGPAVPATFRPRGARVSA